MSLRKIFTSCNVYIALFLIYYVSNTIKHGPINALMLMGLIALSMYYVYKVNKFNRLPVYFKGLNAFLLLLSLYGFCLVLTHDTILIRDTGDVIKSNTNLRFLYASILPIYPCYYFARKGMLTEQSLKLWIVLFMIVAYISYHSAQVNHIQRALELGLVADNTNFTNNVAYTFLLIMPCFSLFQNRKYLFFGGLAICLFLILAASKRGAILISVIIAVIQIRSYFRNLRLTSNKKVIYYIFLFLCLYFAVSFALDYILSNEYLYAKILSIQEGNSSGRDDITDFFFNKYLNDYSFVEMVFGGGADNTIICGPNYAHNDWLEVLINEGLVGVGCYLYYWICFYKTYKAYKYCKYGVIIGMVAIILFLLTIFSMSYTSMNLYVCCILGFCLANSELEIYNNRLK